MHSASFSRSFLSRNLVWVVIESRMGVGLRVGLLVALASIARGYTPALPVNDTTTLQRSSDVIQITWEPSGVFRSVPRPSLRRMTG